MLLSSDASDNLLLFVTVEGPVVTAVDWFTGSYIISKGARFLRPFSTQQWNVLKAGSWDISVQWPCVSRIPSAWPSNKMESSVNVTTHAPGCSSNSPDLPWLMDIATKVNPCLTLTHSWPVRSPQPLPLSLPVLPAESSQLSAQGGTMGLDISLKLPVQKAFPPCPSPSTYSVMQHYLSREYCGWRLRFGSVRLDKWSHFSNGYLPIFKVN